MPGSTPANGRGRASEQAGIGSAGRGRGDSALERVTVNLTARASSALDSATQLTGDTKTDTINRALQIYAFVEDVLARGGAIYVREEKDSELERLRIF